METTLKSRPRARLALLTADTIKLAESLLQIAELAMPASYFQSDSRCVHARRVIAQLKGERS